MDAQFRGAFTAAATRWDQIIIGDIPDTTVDAAFLGMTSCPQADLPAVIDDVYICATIEPDDGVGGRLGFAGPETAQIVGTSILPVTGTMSFDSADVQNLVDGGTFESVIVSTQAIVLVLKAHRSMYLTLSTFQTVPATRNGTW